MATLPREAYQQRRLLRQEAEKDQTRRIANATAHHDRLDIALQRWIGPPKEPEPVAVDLDSLDIQPSRK